jgi:UDP-N-acetylglucosamine transferase subunit ALG13
VIFVSVGTQLAFDRLISAVDGWAATSPDRKVFAQIGPSRFRPNHIDHAQFISPQECVEHMKAAEAVVAHAGIGTILTALELGKPLVVMPRRADFGEHRNDHQLATARRFAALGRVSVAFDESEVATKLDELHQIAARPQISAEAPQDFVAALRAFIAGQPLSPSTK